MFDAFKNLGGGGKNQKALEELQALIDRAQTERRALREALATAAVTKELIERGREERRSLSDMLVRVSAGSAKLRETGRTLTSVETRANSDAATLEALASRVEELERRAAAADAASESEVAKYRREARQLTVLTRRLDGQIAKIKAGVQQAARAEKTLARLDALVETTRPMAVEVRSAVERLAAEKQTVAALEGRLAAGAQAVAGLEPRLAALDGSVREAERRLAALTGGDGPLARVDALSGTVQALARETGELGQTLAGLEPLRQQLAGLRDTAGQTAADVARVTERLGAVEALASRLDALQAVAANMDQRVALQRAAVEMIDARVSAFHARAPELDALTADLLGRLARLEAGMTLAGQLGDATARLEERLQRLGERCQAVDALEPRLAALDGSVQDTERRLAALTGGDGPLARVDALSVTVQALTRETGELGQTLTGLEPLRQQLAGLRDAAGQTAGNVARVTERLGAVEALASRLEALQAVAANMDQRVALQRAAVETLEREQAGWDALLRQSHAELNAIAGALDRASALRKELQDLQAAYGDAARLRDALFADRAAVEAIDARVSAFHARAPELDAATTDLLGRLAPLEAGMTLAGQLGDATARLEQQFQQLDERSHVVDALERRLDALQTVAADVDRQLVIHRRGLDALTQERAAVQEVRTQLQQSHGELQQIAQSADRALSGRGELERLADDVNRNVRALEARKTVVEEAIDNAARLDGMVASIDARTAKIDEALQKTADGEAAVARLDRLVGESRAGLESATRLRAEAAQEAARMERSGQELVDGMRRALEQLAREKDEITAFDGRLRALQAALQDAEGRMTTLSTYEEQLAYLPPRLAELSGAFDVLMNQAEAIARKQADLGDVWNELVRVTQRMELLGTVEDQLRTLQGAAAQLERRVATAGR